MLVAAAVSTGGVLLEDVNINGTDTVMQLARTLQNACYHVSSGERDKHSVTQVWSAYTVHADASSLTLKSLPAVRTFERRFTRISAVLHSPLRIYVIHS
jgi:hypothetical protein